MHFVVNILLISFICLVYLIFQLEANALPKAKTHLPGRNAPGNKLPGHSAVAPSKPHIILPEFEPMSYIHHDRFLMMFKDKFTTAKQPFSFKSVQEALRGTCSFRACPEATIKGYVRTFFATLRTKPSKSESFCHHLLASHVNELHAVFELEAEPLIFAELWKTCASTSFYRSATYMKPARRVELKPGVYLESMKEFSLILPDNIFVPSEVGKEDVEIVRFIGESEVRYLVESLTPGILHASLERSPREVQMKLFEKFFIQRPFDQKGIRFPQPEKSWSFWSWIFGSNDEST